MADWTDIPDANLEPDRPIRSVDGLALRDNPIALADGASGAPRIQTNAIENDAVTQDKIASNSVGRSEAISGTSSTSGTIGGGGNTGITLDNWALFPSFGGAENSSDIRIVLDTSSASASSPKVRLVNTDSQSARTYDIAWRYINS